MKRNGDLDLSGTPIQSLPEGLTVGGGLYLSGTQIQSLPEGLTVGGWLDLSGTQILDKTKEKKKVKTLRAGAYIKGKYLYADGILTHIKDKKTVGKFTLYVGKIKGKKQVLEHPSLE